MPLRISQTESRIRDKRPLLDGKQECPREQHCGPRQSHLQSTLAETYEVSSHRVQGNTASELPEELLGAVRVSNLQLKSAVHIPQ